MTHNSWPSFAFPSPGNLWNHGKDVSFIPFLSGPRYQAFEALNLGEEVVLLRHQWWGRIRPTMGGELLYIIGCFLKWWYPQSIPKWSFLLEKPMVVGYHRFRKPPISVKSSEHSFHITMARTQQAPGVFVTPQSHGHVRKFLKIYAENHTNPNGRVSRLI